MDAIGRLPKGVWTAGIEQNDDRVEDTFVADLTGLLDLGRWHDKISDLRIIVRDEPLHPRYRKRATEREKLLGRRYQLIAINTKVGQLAWLDARHRSHVHVENDVKQAKDLGLNRWPSGTGRSTWPGPRLLPWPRTCSPACATSPYPRANYTTRPRNCCATDCYTCGLARSRSRSRPKRPCWGGFPGRPSIPPGCCGPGSIPRRGICVRQSFYSVPARYAGRRLTVRLGATTVEALDGARIVAAHDRALGRYAEVLTLDHYLEVLKVKPGALAGATALAQAKAAGVFTQTHQRYWDAVRQARGDTAGTKALVEILLAHRTQPAAALIAAMDTAVATMTLDPQVVLIEARRHTARHPAPVTPRPELDRYERPPPGLSVYDELLTGTTP
ncbi:MAG: transposase [Acidimicrobiales bacterium]|nr:transposase [Acidimicrobiales bacterium]